MSSLSQEPGAPRKGNQRRWKYLPVDNGGRCNGFIGGTPFGVFTHWEGHDKACPAKFSSGELACAWCSASKEPVWRAYVPLFDTEYTPRFVLVPEEFREVMTEWKPGDLVEITRAKATREPVVIRHKPWRLTPLPTSVRFATEHEFLLTLLKCWKNPELNRWVMAKLNSALFAAAPAAPLAPTDEGKRILQAAGERELDSIKAKLAERFVVDPNLRPAADDESPKGKPERNGKHAKK